MVTGAPERQMFYFFTFIFSLFQLTNWVGHMTADYWIGLTDRQIEGTFVWESGRQLSADIAKKWTPNQPDNYLGDQDCAYRGHSSYHNKLMDDTSCNGKKEFICQKRSSWSEPWSELYVYVEELV